MRPRHRCGFILTRGADLYGRCVAFAGRGPAPEPSGTQVFADADLLATTVNHHQLSTGLAYPTYYRNLFPQLRDAFTTAVAAAQAARRGVWVADATTTASLLRGVLATPAGDTAAQPLPVTAREREIAALIAAGLSNREIADRLVVSVRTIEGHIYRACLKLNLDIGDRDQLAGAAGTTSTSLAGEVVILPILFAASPTTFNLAPVTCPSQGSRLPRPSPRQVLHPLHRTLDHRPRRHRRGHRTHRPPHPLTHRPRVRRKIAGQTPTLSWHPMGRTGRLTVSRTFGSSARRRGTQAGRAGFSTTHGP